MLDDISRDLGERWFRATLSHMNCTHDSFCTLTSHSAEPSHVHMLTQKLQLVHALSDYITTKHPRFQCEIPFCPPFDWCCPLSLPSVSCISCCMMACKAGKLGMKGLLFPLKLSLPKADLSPSAPLELLEPKADLPSSAALERRGSKGTLPRKGTCMSFAICSAPPLLAWKTSVCATQFCKKKNISETACKPADLLLWSMHPMSIRDTQAALAVLFQDHRLLVFTPPYFMRLMHRWSWPLMSLTLILMLSSEWSVRVKPTVR